MMNVLESDIKSQIKDYLDYTGWTHFPLSESMYGTKGVPDRVAIKNGVIIWLEIKRNGNKQSKGQIEFQEMMEDAGGNYCLAYSVEDLDDYIYELTGEKNLLFS